MKKKFDWDRFISPYNDKVVHCETREEAELFCNLMHEHGLKWEDGELYTDVIEWDKYKQDTCYNSDGLYANLNFYKDNGCEILKFSDYDFTGESEKNILNANFYKDEIDKLDKAFKVTRTTREIRPCGNCYDCIFSDTNKSCMKTVIEWLLSPYKPPKEKPVITDTVETFLKMCNPECYIARRKNGSLSIYDQKPIKTKTSWSYEGQCVTIKETITKNLYEGFNFIEWEDDEPWKVDDLLKIVTEQ